MLRNMKIILGSQSKGRREVLKRMGYDFDVMFAGLDEKAIRCDDPVQLSLALANAKADALLPQIKEPSILITSDQVVACNGALLEKPADKAEAENYLKNYTAYPAETITSVVVCNTANGVRKSGTDIAKIWLAPLPDEIVEQYIATGECFLCSGGFDHEHHLLKPFVLKIEGEKESITGLPKSLTERLIKEAQEI